MTRLNTHVIGPGTLLESKKVEHEDPNVMPRQAGKRIGTTLLRVVILRGSGWLVYYASIIHDMMLHKNLDLGVHNAPFVW